MKWLFIVCLGVVAGYITSSFLGEDGKDLLLIILLALAVILSIICIVSWKRKKGRERKEFNKSHKNWSFERTTTDRMTDYTGKEHRPNCMICKEEIWDEESFMSCHPVGYFICFKCIRVWFEVTWKYNYI